MSGSYFINGIIKWVNVLTWILSLPIIILAAWLYTAKGSACETFLQPPLLFIGISMFFLSILGYYGAKNKSPCILWIYLVLMLFLIMLLVIFTIFAMIVSVPGGKGQKADDNNFKEYKLENYSPWLKAQLGNEKRWNSLSDCFAVSSYCEHLDEEFTSVSEYKKAKLSPTEAGCCRPPSECGYTQVNATYFTTSPTQSTNDDCKLYSNDKQKMCFSCGSCRGGVAYYIRKRWKTVAIINFCLLFFLILLYAMGCAAKRNATAEIEFQRLEAEEMKKLSKKERKSMFRRK